MIVAIDGPAGSGKSSVAKILAQKLGFKYIDTGAIYRAITLKVFQNSIDFNDEKKICQLIDNTKIELIDNNGTLKVLLDSVNVTTEIRNSEVTNKIVFISGKSSIRKKLIKHQKECAYGVNAIVEGRDIGTVIFPDAEKKFFLSANIEERANRRYLELKKRNSSIKLEDVLQDIEKRDKSDSTRKAAPLKKSDDAVFIDTTNLSLEEVVDNVRNILDL